MTYTSLLCSGWHFFFCRPQNMFFSENFGLKAHIFVSRQKNVKAILCIKKGLNLLIRTHSLCEAASRWLYWWKGLGLAHSTLHTSATCPLELKTHFLLYLMTSWRTCMKTSVRLRNAMFFDWVRWSLVFLYFFVKPGALTFVFFFFIFFSYHLSHQMRFQFN